MGSLVSSLGFDLVSIVAAFVEERCSMLQEAAFSLETSALQDVTSAVQVARME